MAKIKKMGAAGREIRAAVIGLGGRGCGQTDMLLGMPDFKVAVVCDVYQDRIDRMCDECEKRQGFRPDGTTDYTEAIGRDDSMYTLETIPEELRKPAKTGKPAKKAKAGKR